MNIVVTGAAGTIGRPLVLELRKRGHKVRAVDKDHGPGIFRADCGEYRQLRSALQCTDSDSIVFHLAAEFGRRNGHDYYEQMWRSNVIAMEHLLREQAYRGFRLVFFSSSEVYGEGPWGGLSRPALPGDSDDAIENMISKMAGWDGLPRDERLMDTVPVCQPNSYAISKWVNECQCLNAARGWGKNRIVRLRLFCTYGPGEYYTDYRSVCAQFAYRLLHRLPITVYANTSRTFLFIDDLIPTLANLAEPGVFKPGEVYNLGGREPTNIGDLARLTQKIIGMSDADFVALARIHDTEPMNTPHKNPSIEKAVRDLGHDPKVGIEEGMRRTIDWMRQVYGLPAPGETPACLSI